MLCNKLSTFSRSDLACERRRPDTESGEVKYRDFSSDGFHISELSVHTDTDYPKGRYVTVEIGKIWMDSNDRLEACRLVLAEQILDFIFRLTGHRDTGKLCLMIAGLGNRFITADSLGPLTVDKLTVTGHMMGGGSIFDSMGCARICAVQPGVLGQTGIEAASIIRGAVTDTRPDVIIAVDALAARSPERLATTVQIWDSGIRPGSGIGNKRCAVNAESTGCPVIAVGIPTVVDSSTLVCDALERAGIEDYPSSLSEVLENGRSFFVSPKDSDIISEELSSLLASAIDTVAGI